MRHAKFLGLVAIALAALMLMSGTASATILTSPAGTIYTSTIKAEQAETITMTSVFGGFGAISCKKSILETKVQIHGLGVTAGGDITHLSFSECTGGEPTTATSTSGAGSLQVHGSSPTDNGIVTALGTKLTVHKTVFGTCPFEAEKLGTRIGTLTGSSWTGGSAIIDVESAKFESPCGKGTLEGKYRIVTPSFLAAH
jgi:hypothetical protein